MTHGLSEEQKLIQQTAREFAAQELLPHVKEWDKAGFFPKEVALKLGQLGFLGMLIPEEWGGAGLDPLSYILALEEICKVDPSMGVTMAVQNSLPTRILLTYGTNEQKERFLRPMAEGRWIGAFALSEAGAGSDVASIELRAEKSNGKYVLNGQKLWVSNGATADVIVTFAKTSPQLGARGITAFVLTPEMPGLSPGKEEKKMGIRASNTTALHFDNVEVPEDQRLGEEGKGFIYAMSSLDQGRLGIAAQALGIAQACLEHMVSYSRERKQFGEPIASFQAIQFMIADVATEIEAARALLHGVARKLDDGEKVTKQASMAKLFASEVAMKAAVKAVQVFGGYGYMEEYPVARYFRDAKVTQIYEGTSEIQKIVIARQLLGEDVVNGVEDAEA